MPPMTPTAQGITLAQETFGKAVPVAEGFWILATRHRPGLSKNMFEINNRCLIFRLNDQGKPVLLVANAVDPAQAFGEVHRIEKETGLAVRYLLSVGGGHHLHMAPWVEEFQQARVLLPPVRVPRTRNGQKLLKMSRVEVMNLEDPLPQFKGQLDAVVFHGLLGLRDTLTAGEGGPDTGWAMMKVMFEMVKGPSDPVDELWLHHAATGTVVAGENLAWYYPAAERAKLLFMGKAMIKADKVWIFDKPRKVGDAAVVAACWKKVLAWPARALMTYHDPPGNAATQEPQAALERAVRDVRQLGA